MNTKDAIKKFEVGDALTSMELKWLISWYKDLAEKLNLLGSVYFLSYRAVSSDLSVLENYWKARARK